MPLLDPAPRDGAHPTRSTHLLADLWRCDPGALGDATRLATELSGAARAAGAIVLSGRFVSLASGGVSGVAVLAESHIAVHTTPSLGHAAIDVFTCGDCRPRRSVELLQVHLGAAAGEITEVLRGSTTAPRVVARRVDTRLAGATVTLSRRARHLLLELLDADASALDCEATVADALTAATAAASATVVATHTHRFAPQGVAGVALLGGSHVSIHTWPEHRYAAVDVFVQPGESHPEAAVAPLVARLGAQRQLRLEITRGGAPAEARAPRVEAGPPSSRPERLGA